MNDFQIKYFAERLKKIAKENFGGVVKLANALQMSQGQLSNYTKQKDTREPGISFLYKLAKLGVDIHYLLTGEKFMDEGIQKQIEEQIKKLEQRIVVLESENYRCLKRIEELEIENKQFREENKTLGVSLSRVAEVNNEYSKMKKHKNGM